MTVRSSPFSCSSRSRRWRRLVGRKPSNTKRPVGWPLTARAVTQALAAGTGTTLMPSASASATITSPGSEMAGMPASEHRAQFSPAWMRSRM